MRLAACTDFFAAAPMGRREFLRAGSLSLAGLGLPQLLHARPQRSGLATSANGHHKARACIMLFMWGGPAHQDTWDMKPTAPAEYRGEFKPISTNVPGVTICEHLPRLAGHADKLAIIRSMTHGDVDHTSSTHFLLTGRGVPRRGAPHAEDWPSYGAVLAKLGRGKGPLPPFVSMMPEVPHGAPRFVEESHGKGAGWLGPVYGPMQINADASKPGYEVGDFNLHADVPLTRTQRRRDLLRDLDQQVRGLLDETLVVWTGEMGRTPRVGQSVVGGAGAGRDGRDHWAGVFTTVLAGGGIKGGIVHGASDRYAAYPAAQPTAPADLAATIYHCLGVDPRLQLQDTLGRPMTLCEGAPIQALLA